MKDQICPAVPTADFIRLGEEVSVVLDAGDDMVYIDALNRHSVPALFPTPGPPHCPQHLAELWHQHPGNVHIVARTVDNWSPDL